MTLSVKEAGRGNIASMLMRYPVIAVPPNDVDLYATISAITTSLTDVAVTGRTAIVTCGAPANITVQVTTGANFDASKTLTVTVSGFDENGDAQTEQIVCTGSGSAPSAPATQTFSGKILWSYISSILNRVNATVTTGPNVTIGHGDGANPPTTLLMANPFPFVPPASVALLNMSSTATGTVTATAGNYITVTGDLANGMGGFRAWKLGTNFGAVANTRLMRPIFLNVPGSTVEFG